MPTRQIRRFDVVLSLGQSCQVAYQMKRRGLRTKSGPFDWFTVPMAGLFAVLESNFENFMQEENLAIVENREGKLVVRDETTKIRSLHDFHAPHTIEETWPSFKAKMDRRVNAFRRDIAEAGTVLFIRYGISQDESIRLIEILKQMRNKKPCALLALDPSFSPGEEPYAEEVIPVYMPKQDNLWKGHNAEWNRVLSPIRLAHPTLRQYQDRFNCLPLVEKIRKRVDRLFLRENTVADPR